MSRPGVLLLPIFALLCSPPVLFAQKRPDPIATELAVQAALQQGRQLLTRGEPHQAVEVLEGKLAYINGNIDYLSALRDAYSAAVRDLQLKKLDDQAGELQEKLRVLEFGLKPARPSEPDLPPAKARGKVDPFQQTPLMNDADARELARRGDVAFAQKNYAEATRLFSQAHAKDPASLGPRTADWAYCRIHAVVERLKDEQSDDPAGLAALDRELTQALALAAGKPELIKFGRSVQTRLRERQGVPASSTPAETGAWSIAESTNFRLLHQLSAADAEKLLPVLEKARSAAYEKWFGAPSHTWAQRCDIYLHDSAAKYTKTTGKDARGQGHSTLEVVDRKVTRRRIDLVGDAPDLAAAAIPREVTHVVLIDLFPDPMLPRWADEAMAILAEPRDSVQRYLRALPKVARDGKLFAVGQLMTLKEFPDPAAITAFYVQSVSLVDLLVAEKGPQVFALFLQHAQRYGFEKALKENYGIKSFAALQEHWQKKAFAAD